MTSLLLGILYFPLSSFLFLSTFHFPLRLGSPLQSLRRASSPHSSPCRLAAGAKDGPARSHRKNSILRSFADLHCYRLHRKDGECRFGGTDDSLRAWSPGNYASALPSGSSVPSLRSLPRLISFLFLSRNAHCGRGSSCEHRIDHDGVEEECPRAFSGPLWRVLFSPHARAFIFLRDESGTSLHHGGSIRVSGFHWNFSHLCSLDRPLAETLSTFLFPLSSFSRDSCAVARCSYSSDCPAIPCLARYTVSF